MSNDHRGAPAQRSLWPATDARERQKPRWKATIGFTHYTTEDGLAYDRVGWLAEDSKGTIWIGTERGISRYDGASFGNLTAEEGLVDGDVNSIVEARSGDIWIATRGNSYVYDGTRFTPITTPDGLTFTNVRSIIEDDAGMIWIGGSDGLWRTDGRSYTKLSPRFTGYLFKARDGRIWASAAAGREGYGMALFVVDPGAGSIGGDPLKTVIELKGQVFGIEEDTDGNIWFGTERGVQRYDGTTVRTFEE